MAQEIKKLNKKVWVFVSFLIVSAIVGIVRLGFPLGLEKDGDSVQSQKDNSLINIARADEPPCPWAWCNQQPCGNCDDCGSANCGDCGGDCGGEGEGEGE